MASRSLSVPRSRSGIRRPPSGRLRVVRFHPSATGVRKPTFERFRPLIATIAGVSATTCSDLKRRVSSSKSSSGAPESGSRVRASHQASAARLPVQKHSASRQTATMSRRYRSHRAHAPQRRVRPNGVGAAADLRGSDLDQCNSRGSSSPLFMAVVGVSGRQRDTSRRRTSSRDKQRACRRSPTLGEHRPPSAAHSRPASGALSSTTKTSIRWIRRVSAQASHKESGLSGRCRSRPGVRRRALRGRSRTRSSAG